MHLHRLTQPSNGMVTRRYTRTLFIFIPCVHYVHMQQDMKAPHESDGYLSMPPALRVGRDAADTIVVIVSMARPGRNSKPVSPRLSQSHRRSCNQTKVKSLKL